MLMRPHVGFCHEHALILYVYLSNDNGEDESVLTVSCLFGCGSPGVPLTTKCSTISALIPHRRPAWPRNIGTHLLPHCRVFQAAASRTKYEAPIRICMTTFPS